MVYIFKYGIILSIIYFVLQARSASLDCTFDYDFCDWNQMSSDQFDWTRDNGNTKSSSTGPRSDHTTAGYNGYYIYTETSRPRQVGDIARIISPVQQPGLNCFIFWYSMYGSGIGTLNVYMVPNNTAIFSKSGNVGDRDWRTDAISYNAPAKYQIVIEGIRGQNGWGDIAVDDISMTSGMCSLDCTFDFGLCLWKQDDSDDFNWTWRKGAASIYETGPLADHTSGHGYYIIIRTIEAYRNERARIISPLLNAGKYCFSIWYYMYGEHVDTLRILTVDKQEKTTEMLAISGNQGAEWIQKIIFLYSTLHFRIIIEGEVIDRRLPYLGDIAVDDITILSCQDCNNPTPRHGRTNSTNFQYGSAIEIICNSGYYISGNPLIVCRSGGTWSASATCEPIECENPNLKYAEANSTKFRYGSAIEITCNAGYKINGSSVIICKADGTWTYIPRCDLIDCGMRIIAHGEFAVVSGTTFGQTATQSCKIGYVLTGDAVVTCSKSGWSGIAATCTIVDCFQPNVASGKISGASTRTTYNQTVGMVCEDGYELFGNATVTCQADGNWTTVPTCIMQDSENSAMIAVYVLVPVVSVAVVIAVLAIIWRKKVFRWVSALDGNREHDKQSNSRYMSNLDCALSQDTEYATIMDDRNGKVHGDNFVYYNVGTVTVEQETVEHIYDHANISVTPVVDNTYLHISGDKDRFESSYDTTLVQHTDNVSIEADTKTMNQSYDVLAIKHSE